MKKEVIVLLLLGILLVSPLVLAQEQAQTYSGINRFIDNVKLAFSGGDNKVRLALEVREKEVDSAMNNFNNEDEEKAVKNLERAKEKLKIVQEKVSLDTSEEIKENINEIKDKINKEENLLDEFEEYLLEEEKTQLTAELTEKTYEYCKELAKEDFALMLKEEECNPDTAVPGLEKELEKLKDLQEESFVQLMLEIRSCIDDPGTCNCEANVDVEQKAKCEKMVALAVKCEYKNDENACNELKSMKPVKGDGFAESFVPDFFMDLFKKKEDMIDYNIEKSDVPEECQNENEREKPECARYRGFKELSDKCWDKEGNFLLDECGGPENREPTMRESIPQCYDEDNNFLEEKCGKITMVRNEEGLVNYIIEKEIDNVINDFENKSAEHLMEIRSGWMMVENKWVIDKGDQGINNKTKEIKKEMNQIDTQIKDIIVKNNVVKSGMDIDLGKRDPDATPKTPVPTDGSICCKTIMSGHTKYSWDYEEDCLNPATIKGEVVDNDFCVALGTAIDDEDDDVFNPGVPEGPGDVGVVVEGDGSGGEIGNNVVDDVNVDSGTVDVDNDGGDSG